MRQSFTAWFTEYPSTHELAGQSVEVVARDVYEAACAPPEVTDDMVDRAWCSLDDSVLSDAVPGMEAVRAALEAALRREA